MAIHFHVKKGDTVEVISGNHRGANGKILQVLGAKQQVLIEGVRLIKKHTKRTQDNPQGGILEREGPIHISNVKLVDKTEKPAKARRQKERRPKRPPRPKSPRRKRLRRNR